MSTKYYADVVEEISEMEQLGVSMPSNLNQVIQVVKRNAPEWEQSGLPVSEAASLALELC